MTDNQQQALTVPDRRQQLQETRDQMTPGARPIAIVPRTFQEAYAMCEALARASLVPGAYRDKPQDMVVVVMAGAEIGIPPLASLRLYHLMDGVPRLSAEGIRAVILQSPDCEYFEPDESSATRCRWVGKKRGRPEKTATWTIERAKQALLTERRNRDGSPGLWMKYPEDMLNARASMQLGKMVWPHVVAGMISTEEAYDGAVDASFVEVVDKPKFMAISTQGARRATQEEEAQVAAATKADPTMAPPSPPRETDGASSMPSAAPSSTSTERTPSTRQRRQSPAAPSPAASPGETSSPKSKLEAATAAARAADDARAHGDAAAERIAENIDRWGQKIATERPTESSPSTESASTERRPEPSHPDPSGVSGGADDGFGEDAEDAEPPPEDPIAFKKLFTAWLQGLKTREQALKEQRAWTERAVAIWPDTGTANGKPIRHPEVSALGKAYADRKGALP